MDIFSAKFFPKTNIIDLNNIEIEATMEQKVFNISPIILTKEINKLIKGLLNKKVLGLNGILNEVFKVIPLIIAKDLTKTASYYFINGTIPKSLKEFIIVALCKKRKKENFFLSSYRLVALENMLMKVLKKHVANIILKVMEKYKLFPWNQIGGRRK